MSSYPGSLEREAVKTASRLVRRHGDNGAVLCEWTNLPPHAAAVQDATGLPVHDAEVPSRPSRSLAPRRFKP